MSSSTPLQTMRDERADESRYDFRHKRVGVVGNGSSSIQIVPSLQPLDGIKMTVFMRSQTWISGAFGDAAMLALGLDPKEVNCEHYTDSSTILVDTNETANSYT